MKQRKIISILLVVIWMTIVFCFSNQQGEGSSNISHRVATKIVEIIDFQGHLSQSQKEEKAVVIEPYLRKIAHYSIYLIGGILLINAAQQLVEKEQMQLTFAGITGVLYAISDEVHQVFMAGRSGNVIDVIIDSLGVFTGICIFLLIFKLITRSKEIEKGGN